jgi:hypothetical protein
MNQFYVEIIQVLRKNKRNKCIYISKNTTHENITKKNQFKKTQLLFFMQIFTVLIMII